MKIHYLILFFSLLACSPINDSVVNPDNQIDTTESNHIRYSEGNGIMVNIAADALGNYPKWKKDIDLLNSAEIISSLQDYIDSYSNTQVTSLLFNVNYQRSCFENKIMETYWDISDPEKNINNWPRANWKINKKGVDPFAIVIARTRQKNMSPWVSIRMNDHHFFGNQLDTLKINKFWQNNPQYRRYINANFDYSFKPVRDYYKAYIKEILDKYNIDGIELDWMRTYSLFKKVNNIEGGRIINDYMKELRLMINDKALQRGHPIKILVRVPSNPTISRSVGLDGVTWIKDGSVDILVPTNWYHPTNFDIPIELWRKEIGIGFTYQIAPCADVAYMIASSMNIKGMLSTIETMKGFAISAYSRGADAVYYFNNFDPTYIRKVIDKDGKVTLRDDKPSILREAGKLSTAINGSRSHVYTYKDPDLKPIPTEAISLTKDFENLYYIHSGPKPIKGKYLVRVGLDLSPTVSNAKLKLKLNNILCEQIEDMIKDPKYQYVIKSNWEKVMDVSETSARVLQFNVNLSNIKDGHNLITIINTQNEVQKMTWLEIYIDN